ncbi:hypothetical protein N8J89_20605 [Crossiella sp. CA-258035]|uniref:hypothetical protein n=1 Tax=Crossiella sp. CA-258035 TaxID=2981138 RepID=UPI0024BD0AD4|nr:hypothetical protein [Crossiella sp. CA-258035]WHT23385.1 hypothetical protein N8J89_20605 [Crossiella sp. CA-258035]
MFTRARLARAIAVLGVLVGLVLMQDTACAEDTHSPGCHSLYSVAVLVADDCAAEAPGSTLFAPLHGPDDHTELLGACLTMLVAVLLALAAASGPRALKTTPARPWTPRSIARRHRPAPSLALLCVLRT